MTADPRDARHHGRPADPEEELRPLAGNHPVAEDLERSAGEGMLPPPHAPAADRVIAEGDEDPEEGLPPGHRATHRRARKG